MRVVVTGGAGFIGTNLIKCLLEQKHKVICIDNLISGKRENIQEFLNNPNFVFMEGDIVNPGIFDKIEGINQIYNLACPASPKFYQRHPIETMKTCFQGVLNVLETANKCQARVLQTSTSEVYGDPLVPEQAETYCGNVNLNGIRACYDEGKRIAETLCCDYRRIYRTNVTIARIFNTYGPYMRSDDGRVIPNFINSILDDAEIAIYGSGNQTRSLCYVSDMVEGLIMLMNSEIDGPVNLGNPNELTINELAYTLKVQMKSNTLIKHYPKMEDDPQIRKPDIRLAMKKLGWYPKISLEQGLERTIAYYKQERSNIGTHNKEHIIASVKCNKDLNS